MKRWSAMQRFVRIFGQVLFALVALLALSACGSGDTETSDVGSSDVADDVVEAPDTDETANSAAPEVEEEDDAAAVDEPDEDVIVIEATTTTVAVAAPTTTEAQDSIVIPDSGPGLGAFAVQVFESGELGLSPAQQGCIDGRLQAELRENSNTDIDELSVEQQAVALEILFDCAGGELEEVFLAEFEPTPDMIDLGLGPDFGRCIFREISRDDEDQPAVLLAITSVTADLPAPEETVEVGSRTFARCIDVAELLINEFAESPEIAEVFDVECLREQFDEDAAAALFAASLRDPSGEDDSILAEAFAGFRPCLEFGRVFATQFALEGVTLNEAEITCIDAAFQTDEVFDALVGDDDLPASAEASLINCLEPETLLALGG